MFTTLTTSDGTLYIYLYNSFQVQSILWLALSVFGILHYTCDFDVEFRIDNYVYYLYFVYFFSKYAADSFSIRSHPALDLRLYQTGATKRSSLCPSQ
jgi:hypothetical protein